MHLAAAVSDYVCEVVAPGSSVYLACDTHICFGPKLYYYID